MNQFVELLNEIAGHWWPYVFHVTWQASLIAVVVLVLVRLCRKQPAPLRYALVLLALVKFVTPPMLALPTGLFSRFGPVIQQQVQQDVAVRRISPVELAHGEPPVLGEHTNDASHKSAATQSVPLTAAGISDENRGEPIRDSSPSAVVRRLTPETGLLQQIGWRTWLMSLHGIGCLVIGVWILREVIRLLRLARAVERVTDGPLHDCFAEVQRKLRINRPVRLLVSSEQILPMAFGTFRPVVMMPATAIEKLSHEHLKVIFAHELAHHRRWDPWINWGQTVVAILWWFNPLVWRLRHSVCNIREDCCDDLILHHRVTTAREYCEVLLDALERLSNNVTVGKTFGSGLPFHPLAKRMVRVMDPNLQRSVQLSLVGALLVIGLGVILLPGLSTEAKEQIAPNNATETAATPTAGAAAPTSVSPAAGTSKSDQATDTVQAQRDETVTFSGTVVGSDGKPVSGVRVRSDYFCYYRWTKSKIDEAHTLTDEEGRFTLSGLRNLEKQRASRTLIFFHPDLAIGWFKPFWEQTFGAEQLRIKLVRRAPIAGRVTDQQDKPIAGAIVTVNIRMYSARGDSRFLGLWEGNQLHVTTDADGRFLFDYIPVGSKLQLQVKHPRYVTFDSGFAGRNDSNGIHAGNRDVRVKLSVGGLIKGRLVRNRGPFKRQGVLIRAVEPSKGKILSDAITDDQGRYTLSGLSPGTYAVYAVPQSLEDPDIVCTPAPGVRVDAGALPTWYDLSCSTGRVVTGRVLDRETGRPVDDQYVSARIGSNSRISVNATRTDQQGRYQLRVPPGDYQIQTSGWRNGSWYEMSQSIRADENSLSGIDFLLHPRPKFPGRLVGEKGRPVEGTVTVSFNNAVRTTEGGAFRVPAEFGDPDKSRICYAFDKAKTLGVSFYWSQQNPNETKVLQLQPVAKIRGRVVNESGTPIGDARARIGMKVQGDGRMTVYPSRPPWQLTMGADGTFEIAPIPVGLSMRLLIGKPGFQTFVVLEELRPGQTLDLGAVVLKEIGSPR